MLKMQFDEKNDKSFFIKREMVKQLFQNDNW